MIRFCSLGSGSSGNATLVEATSGITTTRLLIDAGFSLRELELRLARAGLDCGDLDAIFARWLGDGTPYKIKRDFAVAPIKD